MGGSNYSSEAVPVFTKENTLWRQLPVTINAVQWNGETNLTPIKDWVESFGDDFNKWFVTGASLKINTLESNGNLHTVSKGDFIVRGVMGEYYPCKPESFIKSHKPV